MATATTTKLIELDAIVDAAEGEGIMARWNFGKELLKERKGKQLPNGRLDELVMATGKSQRELGYRMQFAEVFKTKDEVCNALQTYGSWRDIVSQALPAQQKGTKRVEPDSGNVLVVLMSAEANVLHALELAKSEGVLEVDLLGILRTIDVIRDALAELSSLHGGADSIDAGLAELLSNG